MFFDYLSDDMLYALPYSGYSTRDYAMTGADATRLLEDGDVIDLGDRKIEVLHTPGRGEQESLAGQDNGRGE